LVLKRFISLVSLVLSVLWNFEYSILTRYGKYGIWNTKKSVSNFAFHRALIIGLFTPQCAFSTLAHVHILSDLLAHFIALSQLLAHFLNFLHFWHIFSCFSILFCSFLFLAHFHMFWHTLFQLLKHILIFSQILPHLLILNSFWFLVFLLFCYNYI